MRSPPPDLDLAALVEALARWWGLADARLEHVPLGFGGYHWAASDSTGSRHFVTLDVIRQDSREEHWRTLDTALRTACALGAGGLDFVVAPIRTTTGAMLRPVGDRFAVSVFPWLDVRSRDVDRGPAGPDSVVDLLVRLHDATGLVADVVEVDDLAIEDRDHLARRLADHGPPWSGGAYAQRAQSQLRAHAAQIAHSLRTYDRLAATAREARGSWVVTHGEPKPGNLLGTDAGLVLVDWDTVRLAPAARDIWMLGTAPRDRAAYAARSGRHVPDSEIELFELRWALNDVSSYIRWFAEPHRDDADSRIAWGGLMDGLNQLRSGAWSMSGGGGI